MDQSRPTTPGIDPDLFFGRRRRPDRIYFSRTFPLRSRRTRARGQPARYVTKVFDEPPEESLPSTADEEIDTMEVVHVVNFAPTRKQLKLLVAREAGEVHKLELQELSFDPAATWARQLLTLDGAQAQRLVGMLRAVDNLPLAEGETQRLDDAVIEAVFSDTDAVNRLYGPIRSAFGLSSRTTRQRATSSQWRGDAPQLNAFAGCWTTPSSSRLNAPLAQGERGDSRVSQEVCW